MMEGFQIWVGTLIGLLMVLCWGETVWGDETTISLDEAIDFPNPKIPSTKEDIYPQDNANIESTAPPKAINHYKDNTAVYKSHSNKTFQNNSSMPESQNQQKANIIITNDAKIKNGDNFGLSKHDLVTERIESQDNQFTHLPTLIIDQNHNNSEEHSREKSNQEQHDNVIHKENARTLNDGNKNLSTNKPLYNSLKEVQVSTQNKTGNFALGRTSNENHTKLEYNDNSIRTNGQIGSQQKVVHVTGTRNDLQDGNLQKGKLEGDVLSNETRDSPDSLNSNVDTELNKVNVTLAKEQKELYGDLVQENPLGFEKKQIGANGSTTITTNDRSLNGSDLKEFLQRKESEVEHKVESIAIISNKSIAMVTSLSTFIAAYTITQPTPSLNQTYHLNKTKDDRRLLSEIKSDETLGIGNLSNSSQVAYQHLSANISYNSFNPDKFVLDNQTNSEREFISYSNDTNIVSRHSQNSSNIKSIVTTHRETIDTQQLSDLSNITIFTNSSGKEQTEHSLINQKNQSATNQKHFLHGNTTKYLTAEKVTSKPGYTTYLQASITPLYKKTSTSNANGTEKFLYYTYKDIVEERLQRNSSTKSPSILLDVLTSSLSLLPYSSTVSPTAAYKKSEWQDTSEDYTDSDEYDEYDDYDDGNDDDIIITDKTYNEEDEYRYYEDVDEDKKESSDKEKPDLDHNSDLQWLHHMENVEEHIVHTDTQHQSEDKIHVGIWAHDPYNHPIQHSFLKDNSLSLMVFYTWLAVVTFMLIIAFVAFKHRQSISNFITDTKLTYRRRRTLRTEEGHQLLSANPYA